MKNFLYVAASSEVAFCLEAGLRHRKDNKR